MGELGGVAEQVEQSLSNLGHVSSKGSDLDRTVYDQFILIFLDERLDGRRDLGDQR